MPDYRRALEQIAWLDDGLLTPSDWELVYMTARQIAQRALGYEVRHELPPLRYARPKIWDRMPPRHLWKSYPHG